MVQDYTSITYDEEKRPKTRYPDQLIEYLIKRYQIPSEVSVLELGCGRGDFLEAFKKKGMSCFGCDLSPSSGDFLKALNIPFKVVDLTSQSYPYEDNSFDVIYHKSVIEHVYNPEHMLREMYRILKPGGQVIILTPDWLTQMKTFYDDYTHCRPYTTQSLKDVLTVYGFKNVSTERFYQLPLVWRIPVLKGFCQVLQIFLKSKGGRTLAEWTHCSFFRWAVELMVLGSGRKE